MSTTSRQKEVPGHANVRLLAVCLASIALLAACSKRPNNPSAALIGDYELHWQNGSNCAGRGIESSILQLHADGTSEQHDLFHDGSQFRTAGKWRYDGDDHIRLDPLRATTTLEIDKNGSAVPAELVVQWSNPPNILLNPHDSCLFTKVR